ncbi:hypothetical protein EDC40_101195 [Aminobacter aminovorans]|uniref:Uncharacterized protein n=1 Tax=Aminobacter aminovorans TaxID=83263 RepID=A0A380WP13_AMIAI|nr:hypothetical protein EDC40_101195 [Aminobacter aminovorans]SUU90729.1 Uncharacterised protein [Aminobacter aminovorans]
MQRLSQELRKNKGMERFFDSKNKRDRWMTKGGGVVAGLEPVAASGLSASSSQGEAGAQRRGDPGIHAVTLRQRTGGSGLLFLLPASRSSTAQHCNCVQASKQVIFLLPSPHSSPSRHGSQGRRDGAALLLRPRMTKGGGVVAGLEPVAASGLSASSSQGGAGAQRRGDPGMTKDVGVFGRGRGRGLRW